MSDSESELIFSRLFHNDGNDPQPSVLLVAAHPDDEMVGAGARLRRWTNVGFLHVTDGAPRDMKDARESGFASREDYAQARREEFHKALGLLNISPSAEIALDFVDQETTAHLPEVAAQLQTALMDLKPDVVVTHPYEGGHPDHDSTAWAVAAACDRLKLDGQAAPLVVEMTSYHNGMYGMVAGEFLPDGNTLVVGHELTPEECAFKRRLYACFKTQQRTLRWFPIENESFRIAPRYNFSRPPHDGNSSTSSSNGAWMVAGGAPWLRRHPGTFNLPLFHETHRSERGVSFCPRRTRCSWGR
jgi:LmbE family N-acetylglucosaminyl deacetylase